jgi:hypothetical protein
MAEVVIDIVRLLYDYDHWPEFVEARLIDIAGREWSFHDKPEIFSCEDINAKSLLPQRGVIRCQIVGHRTDSDGREITIIDTELPVYVEATTGETRFEVAPDQVHVVS